MAQNKILNVQPVALTTTLTTNILNCNVTSMAGTLGLLRNPPATPSLPTPSVAP
jgi:hypothetical protein